LNACAAMGRGLGIGGHWLSFEVDGQPIVVGRGETPWWDVYVQERGIATRFGYNAEEQRWAYGAVPRSAGIIRQVVHGKSATR